MFRVENVRVFVGKWENYCRFRDAFLSDHIHYSVEFEGSVHLESPCVLYSGVIMCRSRIGCYSYVAPRTALTDCSVGKYSSIGPDCIIGGLGKHPTNHFSTSPLTFSTHNPQSIKMGHIGCDIGFDERAEVLIGNDVWVGARAMILDGVTVGTGAIIGANTVVAKDVPPYAICYGSPAKVHRYRFNPSAIKELLASEWWDLGVGEIDAQTLQDLIK
jgi:acetyltransferase-like isoleucine patch superfamily enzyme